MIYHQYEGIKILVDKSVSDRLMKCCARDETRPVLHCVHIEYDQTTGEAILVSTDTYRLCIVRLKGEEIPAGDYLPGINTGGMWTLEKYSSAVEYPQWRIVIPAGDQKRVATISDEGLHLRAAKPFRVNLNYLRLLNKYEWTITQSVNLPLSAYVCTAETKTQYISIQMLIMPLTEIPI